jgi:hypothetical protein
MVHLKEMHKKNSQKGNNVFLSARKFLDADKFIAF